MSLNAEMSAIISDLRWVYEDDLIALSWQNGMLLRLELVQIKLSRSAAIAFLCDTYRSMTISLGLKKVMKLFIIYSL